MDQPELSREYVDHERLAVLLQELAAVESWVDGLSASTPVKLLVAATVDVTGWNVGTADADDDLRGVAGVCAALAKRCAEAAPPFAPPRRPSEVDVASWVRPISPKGHELRLDHLIHALQYLPEHLAGLWFMEPPRHAVRHDGSVDESVPLEFAFSEPPDDTGALIEALGLSGEGMISWDLFVQDSNGRFDQVRQAAREAVTDAKQKLSAALLAAHGQGEAAGGSDTGAVPHVVHSDLMAALDEITAALENELRIGDDGLRQTEPSTLEPDDSPEDVDDAPGRTMPSSPRLESRWRAAAEKPKPVEQGLATLRSWWESINQRVLRLSDEWVDQIPASLAIDRVKRQALKRDVQAWLGYVVQYTNLLRGNAGGYEFLRMTEYLAAICKKISESLQQIGVRATPSGLVATQVRNHFNQIVVPIEIERRWRHHLGPDAEGVGRMIAEIGDGIGHSQSLMLQQVIAIATGAGLVTAASEVSKRDATLLLLVKMQRLGLAARMPVPLFPTESQSEVRRHARKRSHDGRQWWFNPLGAVLALPSR